MTELNTAVCDIRNNLPEISFNAGTEKTLTFAVYDEDGVTPLNINTASAVWKLCQYGEFQTTILTKTGVVEFHTLYAPAHHFSVQLDPVDTLSLSGKFIQQTIVTDNDGNTFVPGQGIVLISPSSS